MNVKTKNTQPAESRSLKDGSFFKAVGLSVGNDSTAMLTQSETHSVFVGRIEQNMKDYANGRLSFIEQDTDAICMSEAYMYLRSAENLSDSDMQHLLRFRNPLQVIADVYSNLDGTPGIEFAINRVLDNYNGCTDGYALADPNIQSDAQKSQVINGELSVGDWVVVAPQDAYGNLVGKVVKITLCGSPEHMGGETDDVHVDITESGYRYVDLEGIDEYTKRIFGEEHRLEDLIISPDSLINITAIDTELRRSFVENGAAAAAYCNQVIDSTQDDLHAVLMARLDKNLNDYHNSLMGFGKREIIDMAGKIAAMKDVHNYMTTTRGFDDDEIQFYLQFQSPLEVVADAWLERNADNEDLCFTMDFVFDKKDALVDYPLKKDEPAESVKASAEPPKETHASGKEKSAFERGLERGKAKADANKAQKASEPTKTQKNKEAIE